MIDGDLLDNGRHLELLGWSAAAVYEAFLHATEAVIVRMDDLPDIGARLTTPD